MTPSPSSTGNLIKRYAGIVAAFPQRIVLREGARELSYQQLDEAADQIARQLQQSGLKAGGRVVVVVDRSIEAVAGILAVLKCGGCYVPVDTHTPEERVQFISRDCGAQLRLRFPVAQADQQTATVATAQVEQLGGAPTSTDAAYIIYTSGSTGQPKGVMVSETSLLHLFDALQPAYQFSQHDVWTLFHSIGFDFSVWEMWGALLHGGTLVVVSRSASKSPAHFLKLLVSEGVTVLNQTPTAFAALTGETQAMPPEERAGLALRLVIMGGEALDPAICLPWIQDGDDRIGNASIFNMYGITEATVHTTMLEITAQVAAAAAGGWRPIGQPVPGYTVEVLTASGQPCDPDEIGELYIGGPGVALGYVSAEASEHGRFGKFGANGQRLFRTGDLVSRGADQSLHYHGRADDQIKLRGHRIEPGEIEQRLRAHPDVLDASVLLAQVDGMPQLAAFLVWRSVEFAGAAALTAFTLEKLPRYMVPTVWRPIAELPRTTNGKVDKRQLLQWLAENEQQSAAAPATGATSLPSTLAAMLAKHVGVDTIDHHANFFDVGANSLSLTLFRQDIKRQLQRDIRLIDLFDYSSIHELSGHLSATEGNA